MAKKRKARRDPADIPEPKSAKYDAEETFDDSADEFYAAKDKIILDDSPETARRRRHEEQEAALQPSDEELLPYEEDDDDEYDDAEEDAESKEDEENDQIWGPNRSDYYDADVIETEADALEEEAEAKRIQQKQLNTMTEADFGFDQVAWADKTENSNEARSSAVIERLPDARVPDGATDAEKMRILEARYPEFKPLAEDFAHLQHLKQAMDAEFVAYQAQPKNGYVQGPGLSLSTKINALSAYLGTLAMYFAVVSSSISKDVMTGGKITALSPAELREHPVIQHLARARQLWDALRDQTPAVAVIASTVQKPDLQQSTRGKPTQPNSNSQQQKKTEKKNKKVDKKHRDTEPDEFELDDDFVNSITLPSSKSKEKKPKKDKAKQIDVQTLLDRTVNAQEDSGDDFAADEKPLTAEEATEKANKKKSLRFYSSQIAQKANKRGAKSRQAGGDDDVPHKERLRDRQERLLKEAEARGKARAKDDEELGTDDDDNGDNDSRPTNANNPDDEYYDLLTAKASKKKADKELRAEAYGRAAAEGAQVYEEEIVGEDGKRKITYAIAKNKGLMPKRKKDVRNPRVKKRKKYDEKMKKLGSVRQVYKGGEGRGGYGGELTGIKSNVVKSVKLS